MYKSMSTGPLATHGPIGSAARPISAPLWVPFPHPIAAAAATAAVAARVPDAPATHGLPMVDGKRLDNTYM
jgi:hypothetical protein